MFRNPSYLAWMALALLAAGLARWRGSSRRETITSSLGDAGTLSRLMPPEAAARRAWKFRLRLGALALLFIALSGPQWGVELVTTTASSHQVLIAIDTSLSMTAEDVKPARLQKAKQELSALLDGLKGNRVGLMAFAGETAMVCPLTTDLEAARTILMGLEPGAVPVPGTAIGKAIRAAVATLQRFPGRKSLVVLTDGEDHRSDPLGAAEEAAAAGVRIFAIGIGTPEGEPIPLKDSAGAQLEGYKKDRRGSTVVSRLGEATLTQIAARTGGAYFRASPGESESSEIVDRILKTEQSQSVTRTSNQYRNRFLLPLALAFLLLLAELLIPERSDGRGARRGGAQPRARAGAALAALLLLLGPGRLLAATAEADLREGNALYSREQYVPALERYQLSGRKRPKDPRPVFNAGDALYRIEQYDQAQQAFEAVAQSSAPAALRSAAYYNLGNIRFQQNQYREAVEDYRKAVALNPRDADAVNNLAVALNRLKNPPPPQKKNQNNPKNQPQDQKKNQQNNQQNQAKQNPSAPKTRPQDQLPKEDAERIMRAVAEKEKAAQRQIQNRAPRKNPQVEEDW